MSAEARREYGSTILLLLLGGLALYGGSAWLVFIVPAAGIVWYAAAPASSRTGRN